MSTGIHSLGNAALGGGSAGSPALLTPPLTPASSEDIPFKPKDSDRVSLTMKMRRHGHLHRRRLNRACLSSGDLQPAVSQASMESPRPAHSRSMPVLNRSRSHPPLHQDSACEAKCTEPSNGRQRRWTLPSKAAPTRALANTVPVENRRECKSKVDNADKLSPAMITLRRATGPKTPRSTSITFFPPPTFTRTKTSFLSTFLSTITGNEDYKFPANISHRTSEEDPRSSRPASLDGGQVQPATSISASPVCTEVADMERRVSLSGSSAKTAATTAGAALRRCSTRYVSGSSIYEVIWDENVSSSNSEGVPSTPEAAQPDRRHSIAMDKLETQLFKAVAQSRRASFVVGAQVERQTSFVPQHEAIQGNSFQEMLNFKFSRLTNEASLRHLPRSQASKSLKITSPAIDAMAMVSEELPEQRYIAPTGPMFHFPPLRSRATTGASKVSSNLGETFEQVGVEAFGPTNVLEQTADEPNTSTKQRDAIGSLVGTSTHQRRRGTGREFGTPRRRSNALESRRASAWPRSRTVEEDETTPLLTALGIIG